MKEIMYHLFKAIDFINMYYVLIANQALIALMAAESNLKADEYRKWAESQIHYILGDSGRSLVVGFGKNPPTHPHHRASYVLKVHVRVT